MRGQKQTYQKISPSLAGILGISPKLMEVLELLGQPEFREEVAIVGTRLQLLSGVVASGQEAKAKQRRRPVIEKDETPKRRKVGRPRKTERTRAAKGKGKMANYTTPAKPCVIPGCPEKQYRSPSTSFSTCSQHTYERRKKQLAAKGLRYNGGPLTPEEQKQILAEPYSGLQQPKPEATYTPYESAADREYKQHFDQPMSEEERKRRIDAAIASVPAL